jgi:hypothetical protein
LYFDNHNELAFQIVQNFFPTAAPIARSVDAAPIYQVSYGYENATNAKKMEIFPAASSGAGRCSVLLLEVFNIGLTNQNARNTRFPNHRNSQDRSLLFWNGNGHAQEPNSPGGGEMGVFHVLVDQEFQIRTTINPNGSATVKQRLLFATSAVFLRGFRLYCRK